MEIDTPTTTTPASSPPAPPTATSSDADWCKKHASFLNMSTEKFTRARRLRLPVALRPWLYLGDAAAATDVARLNRRGITHIINCASGAHGVFTGPGFYGDAYGYMECACEDDEDYPILERHYAAAKAFVVAAGAPTGAARILVHCQAGVNRSAALAVALLVDLERTPLRPALVEAHEKRIMLLTNEGFRRQLVSFARGRGLLNELAGAGGTGSAFSRPLAVVDQPRLGLAGLKVLPQDPGPGGVPDVVDDEAIVRQRREGLATMTLETSEPGIAGWKQRRVALEADLREKFSGVDDEAIARQRREGLASGTLATQAAGLAGMEERRAALVSDVREKFSDLA